jgi:hypothetical protein
MRVKQPLLLVAAGATASGMRDQRMIRDERFDTYKLPQDIKKAIVETNAAY